MHYRLISVVDEPQINPPADPEGQDYSPQEVRNSPPSQVSLAERVGKATAPILAIGGAIGVLLLSFGWSYAWHWFALWQVPFANLGLGGDILLEFGRLVVLKFWYLALAWALVIGLTGFFLARQSASLAAPLLVFGLFLPWLSSHWLGEWRAKLAFAEQREANFGGLSQVHLIFDGDYAAAVPPKVLMELSTGPHLCYRLLFRSNDGLWLVRVREVGSPSAAVFIPKEAIAYLRLQTAAGGSCR